MSSNFSLNFLLLSLGLSIAVFQSVQAVPVTSVMPSPTPTSTSSQSPSSNISEVERLKKMVAGFGVLKNAVTIPALYKDACRFYQSAEMLSEASADSNNYSLAVKLAAEQNTVDVCQWIKSKVTTTSLHHLNCSQESAAKEMKNLCDQVASYATLETTVMAAQQHLTIYADHPETNLSVNSTWRELETEYAQAVSASVSQEIAAVILAPYSTSA